MALSNQHCREILRSVRKNVEDTADETLISTFYRIVTSSESPQWQLYTFVELFERHIEISSRQSIMECLDRINALPHDGRDFEAAVIDLEEAAFTLERSSMIDLLELVPDRELSYALLSTLRAFKKDLQFELKIDGPDISGPRMEF